MTTDDDRPRAAGGYADSGLYNADTQDFSSDPAYDDAGYSSSATTVLPGSPSASRFDDDSSRYEDDDFGTTFDEPARKTHNWHGGLDLGLLVLRLALGTFFVMHGLDKLFGWFTDLGMGNTEQMLAGFGFTEPKILAWVLAVSETAGGVLLILGLFTPVGAAAVLGVMANVIIVRGDWNTFLGGVELEMMYAAAALALLFTGAGRIAIDRNTHWCRRSAVYGIVFLVLTAGACAVTLVVLR
ncbi:MAG TPA: DoxX family protein [Actinophytocola sp.]|nr:DoxX family protein [Actinophytocola sp.]